MTRVWKRKMLKNRPGKGYLMTWEKQKVYSYLMTWEKQRVYSVACRCLPQFSKGRQEMTLDQQAAFRRRLGPRDEQGNFLEGSGCWIGQRESCPSRRL